MGRQWEILSSNNASYYIEVIMEHWTEKYGIGTHIREAILTLKGIMKEPCKNCGACDHCEICDHCKKVSRLGERACSILTTTATRICSRHAPPFSTTPRRSIICHPSC